MVMQATPIPILSLAHAATTGQTANDHHTPTVAGDLNLADLATRAHGDLTAIIATDHAGIVNQSQMEGETNTTRMYSAFFARFAPSAAKLHVSITSTGATEGTLYNVASVTDTGTGDRTVVVDDDFSAIVDSRWIATAFDASAEGLQWNFSARAVGSARHTTWIGAVVLTDIATAVTAYGDQ